MRKGRRRSSNGSTAKRSLRVSIAFAVPLIDDTLEHSILYEEYNGGFNRARQIADAALNDARQEYDPCTLADALLARRIVQLLQGDPLAAHNCFTQIKALVPRDAVRWLRATSYAYFATCRQFHLFPNGAGASAFDVPARFSVEVDFARAELARSSLLNVASHGILSEDAPLSSSVVLANGDELSLY